MVLIRRSLRHGPEGFKLCFFLCVGGGLRGGFYIQYQVVIRKIYHLGLNSNFSLCLAFLGGAPSTRSTTTITLTLVFFVTVFTPTPRPDLLVLITLFSFSGNPLLCHMEKQIAIICHLLLSFSITILPYTIIIMIAPPFV